MTKKIALVDVDSTLWDFTEELRQRMIIKFPEQTIPLEFDSWNHPLDFFDNPEDAYQMFNEIHEQQHSFGTFDFAQMIMNNLRKMGYHILVASNRKSYTRLALYQWLHNHKLKYDEIYCDLDKRVLFDKYDIELVIDDSPQVQEVAIEKEIPVLTLRYKYNHDIRPTQKFKNLSEMHIYMVNNMMIG